MVIRLLHRKVSVSFFQKHFTEICSACYRLLSYFPWRPHKCSFIKKKSKDGRISSIRESLDTSLLRAGLSCHTGLQRTGNAGLRELPSQKPLPTDGQRFVLGPRLRVRQSMQQVRRLLHQRPVANIRTPTTNGDMHAVRGRRQPRGVRHRQLPDRLPRPPRNQEAVPVGKRQRSVLDHPRD